MPKVVVDIEPKTVRLIRSRFFWAIAALTGVSISSCPLLLYQYGKEGVELRDWRVLTCFAVTYLVPSVFLKIASPVVKKLLSQGCMFAD